MHHRRIFFEDDGLAANRTVMKLFCDSSNDNISHRMKNPLDPTRYCAEMVGLSVWLNKKYTIFIKRRAMGITQ